MKIIELSKKYCKEFYKNNFEKMIQNLDGIIFTDEFIKKAFNFGNGTKKDFTKYIENNRVYVRFFDLENKRYI